MSRRGALPILVFAFGLALAACGRYGPPVRTREPVPAVAPAAPASGATSAPQRDRNRNQKPGSGSTASPETTP